MVRLETQIRRYVGLSSDPKPIVGTMVDGQIITAADLPAGSTFLESDVFLADGTQRIARWDGAAWSYPRLNPDASRGVLVEAIESLRCEIASLRLGMIDAGTCKEISAK